MNTLDALGFAAHQLRKPCALIPVYGDPGGLEVIGFVARPLRVSGKAPEDEPGRLEQMPGAQLVRELDETTRDLNFALKFPADLRECGKLLDRFFDLAGKLERDPELNCLRANPRTDVPAPGSRS